MEWQNADIPLTSGLDVKSSDMLVPVSQPLFLHNRQKYQGRYLPSSLRFEHDGWAAGWHVYRFVLNEGFVNSNPEGFKITKQYKYNNPCYRIVIMTADTEEEIGSFDINRAGKVNSYTTAEKPVVNGNIITIYLDNTDDIVVTYDPDTEEYTAQYSEADEGKFTIEVATSSQYISNLTLYDNSVSVTCDISGLILPTDVMSGATVDVNKTYNLGSFYSYQYNEGEETIIWENIRYSIQYKRTADGQDIVTVTDNDVDIPVNNVAVAGNKLTFDFTTDYSISIPVVISASEYVSYISSLALQSSSYIVHNSAQPTTPEEMNFNRWLYYTTTEISGKWYLYNNGTHQPADWQQAPSNELGLSVQLPVWMGLSFKMNLERLILSEEINDKPAVDIYNVYDASVSVNDAGVTVKHDNTYGEYGAEYDHYIWRGTLHMNVQFYVVRTLRYKSYFNSIDDYCFIMTADDIPEGMMQLLLWYHSKDVTSKYNINMTIAGELTIDMPGVLKSVTIKYGAEEYINSFTYDAPNNANTSQYISPWSDRYWDLFPFRGVYSSTPPDYTVTKSTSTGTATVSNIFFITNNTNNIKKCLQYSDGSSTDKLTVTASNVINISFSDTIDCLPVKSGNISFNVSLDKDATDSVSWSKAMTFSADSVSFVYRYLTPYFINDRHLSKTVTYRRINGIYQTIGINAWPSWCAASWGIMTGRVYMDSDALSSATDYLHIKTADEPWDITGMSVDDRHIGDRSVLSLFRFEDGGVTTGSTTVKFNIVATANNIVPIFYTNSSLTSSSDEWSSFTNGIIPGHILYADANYINFTDGINLLNYNVLDGYGQSVDSDYNLVTQFTCNTITHTLVDSLEINVASITDSGHDFIENVLPAFVTDINTEVDPYVGGFNIESEEFEGTQGIKVKFVEGELDITYDIVKGTIEGESSITVEYMGYPITVSLSDNKTHISTELDFFNEVGLLIPADNFRLISCDGINTTFVTEERYDEEGKIINAAGHTFTVNLNTGTVELTLNDGYKYELQAEIMRSLVDSAYSITFDFKKYYIVRYVMNTYFNVKGIELTAFSNTICRFRYNDKEYSISLSDLFSAEQQAVLRFSCIDTRTRAIEEKEFAVFSTDNEFQFIKQQWDTTNNTENFWWIDESHILSLNKNKIVRKVKRTESEDGRLLDDWAGDIFDVDVEWDRFDIITSNVIKYVCSNAVNTSSVFITLEAADSYTVRVNLYDILDGSPIDTATIIDIPLVLRNIGSMLNVDNGQFNTYSVLNAYSMLSQATITATATTYHVIIGVHLDNNFNQWAVVINRSNLSLQYIIQGYGYVGADGSLTGGELPYKYFSVTSGFNSTVRPISDLNSKTNEIGNVTALYSMSSYVVGNAEKQWYVDSSITSIISHIKYENGVFKPVQLYINNNYSIVYASSSFAAEVIGDRGLYTKDLTDVVEGGSGGGGWGDLIEFLGKIPGLTLPCICPKISFINYLQQTIGQAAYVHYNSSDIMEQKETGSSKQFNYVTVPDINVADRSDEVSFDVQCVKQKQATADNPYSTLMTLLASVAVSAVQFANEKLAVNASQNQAADKDTGRKYSQIFLQNLNSLQSSNMTYRAAAATQTSEVTAVKTLDMFYSTSNKQKVCAGPGYVNHNFVAQCVSQSATSLQLESAQQCILYIIKEVGLVAINITLLVSKIAAEVASETVAANNPGITVGSFPGVITNAASGTAALIALATYGVAQGTYNTISVVRDIYSSLVDALSNGGGLQSSITAQISRHNYDIEGKHRYGSRSESFMWPCFDCESNSTYVDEGVTCITENKAWLLNVPTATESSDRQVLSSSSPTTVTNKVSNDLIKTFKGDVPYYIAMVKGKHSDVEVPEDMAYVLGTETFMPDASFKNENIGESEPIFPTPIIHDYVISKDWQLGRTATDNMTLWLSCKDTKIIDGEASNIVITDSFCGVACPYTAIEVKKGIIKKYMRPWAITPQALLLNNTGLNACYEEKAYHACDGYGYRIVNWVGASGMNKERQTWQYSFLVNDRFKRSNKLPLNEFMGNFSSDPDIALRGDYNDRVYSLVTVPGENVGIQAGTIGEDKDVRRYAVPIFSEFINTLPAVVKTSSTYNLTVIDGITSLTSDNRDLQTAYKSPVAVDFSINSNMYRYTSEYICSLKQQQGVTVVEKLVPCLGLEYLGATPYEAYLYSQATRQYYTFNGGTSLQAVDTLERFRDIVNGRYDFVMQEVCLPCIATFTRLDANVEDDTDETDNIIVPRLKDEKFTGELPPPEKTIFDTTSWYRLLSMPSGMVYQGPNRCAIISFVLSDYMTDQIKSNYGKWQRVPREEYHPFRKYKAEFNGVENEIGDDIGIYGWTHNPFLLVTSPIGQSNESDCLFEWEITFCWPVEMNKLYGKDNYAVVNITAETMTPGGKVTAARPTHVYLTKELFTRTDKYGYYSFRYQSKCGAGNRERLHIWSDQYICISGLQLSYKIITSSRTEQLTQQVDVSRLIEI